MSPKHRRILYNFEAKAKTLSVLLLLLIASLTTVFIPYNNVVSGVSYSNFEYHKLITIDHTQVHDTLAGFPVLVNITDDSDLFSHCINDSGYDIAFFSNDNNTQYPHEIDYWNWDTGNSEVDALIWVNVSSVSSEVDTTFYMYYGFDDTNQQDPEGTWNSNYVMVQHMDGAASGDIDDSTSTSQDCIGGSGCDFNQDGLINKAVNFVDEDSDYLDFGDMTTQFDGSFTVEGWFYYDEYDGNDGLVHCYVSGDNNYWFYLYFDGSDKEINFFMDGNGNNPKVQGGANSATTGNWYYGVGVRDTVNDSIHVYIDGVEKDDAEDTSVGTPTYNSINFGRRERGTPEAYLSGKMDEVRLSNVARNESWIITSYNVVNNCTSGAGGFCSFGAEGGSTSASLDMGDSPNSYFTTSGELGSSYYANDTGTYNETANLTITPSGTNPEWIRINVSDIDANITALFINISFDDDNSSWSGNWYQCSAGGETITVNGSNWDSNNWMSGNNPFTADDDGDGYDEITSSTSIYWRVRVDYPSGIGEETYSNTAMTFDGGFYS